MKWKCNVSALLIAISMSGVAWADGQSAAHKLFANLTLARQSIGSLTEANAQVMPTLVDGLYILNDSRGQFAGYVNEAGTLIGSSKNWSVVPTTGAHVRPITTEEIADLRAEVLAGIKFDKLVKVPFGDGGGRKIILFSAIDCPGCKALEASLEKHAKVLNTTFYVVPSSLQEIDAGGLPTWQSVSRIWCAQDSGAAWKAYWASHAVPQPRQCEFSDPHAAAKARRTFQDIFVSVGINAKTFVPVFVREDGKAVNTTSDKNEIDALLRPDGKPQIATKLAHWLVAIE